MVMENQPGDVREEADFEGVSEEVLDARIAEFRQILFEERTKIFQNVKRTLTEDMTIDLEELADDIDRASVDQNQALTFRLRRRERMLLDRLAHADRTIASPNFVVADFGRFETFEIRQDIVERPAGISQLPPAVIVLALSADNEMPVDRGRTAQHFTARP